MKKLNIDDFVDYSITKDGKVYAHHLDRFLNDFDNGLGYKAVKLRTKTGKRKTFYVHRLVAICFVEGYFPNCDVNHKDGNKNNNHYTNLEWCTRSENLKHAYENKLLKGFISRHYH